MRLAIILLLILMLTSCVSAPLNGVSGPHQRTRYYDNRGRFEGYSIDNGNTIKYYNRNGKYIGRSK